MTGLGPRGKMAGAGEGSGPLRQAGELGCGRKAAREKKKKFLSFFFSNFSKQIFKRFSNPNLNLIKPLISKI
jgi:hypothetical protein